MADRSAPAEHRRARWAIRRWLLEAWLWLTVPAAYFLNHGLCPTAWDACRAVADPIESLLLDLFPGQAMIVFIGLGASKAGATVFTVALAGLCQFLLRRFVAKRVGLRVFVAIYAAALGLGLLSAFVGIGLLAGYPPSTYFHGGPGR